MATHELEYGQYMPLSKKQLDALRVIANDENGNEPQDLDTIIGRLSYTTTKQSFQFVVRSLIKRGLIQKCERETLRSKSRRMLEITPLGRHKLSAEFSRAVKPADKRTCGVDEVAITERLLAQIDEDFSI